MNGAGLHLISVHLPVVLAPVSALLLLVSILTRSELVFKLGCLFLLAAALFAVVAYFSGPYAYSSLEQRPEVSRDLVEDHAIAGKAALMAVVLAALMALVALLQELQGETPGRVLRLGVFVAALGASLVLAWAAHRGGAIRHPEIFPAAQAPSPFSPRVRTEHRAGDT